MEAAFIYCCISDGRRRGHFLLPFVFFPLFSYLDVSSLSCLPFLSFLVLFLLVSLRIAFHYLFASKVPESWLSLVLLSLNFLRNLEFALDIRRAGPRKIELASIVNSHG